MKTTLNHVDGELYIFGVDSKKIFRRFKDDNYKSSHEIWALGTQIIRSIENPRRLWRTKFSCLSFIFSCLSFIFMSLIPYEFKFYFSIKDIDSLISFIYLKFQLL